MMLKVKQLNLDLNAFGSNKANVLPSTSLILKNAIIIRELSLS